MILIIASAHPTSENSFIMFTVIMDKYQKISRRPPEKYKAKHCDMERAKIKARSSENRNKKKADKCLSMKY